MMTQFNKYRYLGNIFPEVPETWNNIILKMLADIDYLVKPRFLPRFVLNSFYSHSQSRNSISQIKQKFGTLRVYHDFEDEKIKSIITTAEKSCNNTCEFCGSNDTNLVTIKNWVRNLCKNCIEKHKK